MSVEPITQRPGPELTAQAVRWCSQGLVTAGRTLRRLPATLGYLAALTAVALVMSRLDTDIQEHVLRAVSTNLDNLRAGDLSTLVTSAFVVVDPTSPNWWLMLAALLAVTELCWGSWRAIGVFLAGHLGATVAVAAGLTLWISNGWTDPGVASTVDVGISYGVMALAGAVTAVLPSGLRPVWALTWIAGGAGSVLVVRDFTSAGHLCALGIGLAVAAVALLRDRRAAATAAPA